MRFHESWRRNLGLKLLSVGLAFLLWLHVHGTKPGEREIQLPLRVENLPDSLVLLDLPPATARVLVSGPTQELFFLRFVPGAAVRIDLERARPPIYRLALGPADVHLGSKPRLVVQRVVQPQAVDLRLDAFAARPLPVRVVCTGRPAAGWVLTGTRVDPPQVLCSGPRSRIASLADVPTRPIDLDGRRGPFVSRVELEPRGVAVACEPPSVSVDAKLEREQQRALLDRPVTVLNPPDGALAVDVRPARVTVTVSGPQRALESLDPDAVQVVLDATAMQPGDRQRLRPVTRLPSWARLDRVEPDTVEVVVRWKVRRR